MVEDLIRRARKRYLFNEALAQSAFAAAVSIAGVVLLLIVGTRYFSWWAIALLAVAAIAAGVYRINRRTPDVYATAIRLDERAGLHDALSTALYFSGHQGEVSESFRRPQREQAETAAGAVALEQAMPFVFPRAVYAMAALALLASGLGALRYHLGLDLRSPLAQALLKDRPAGNPEEQEVKKADPKQLLQEAQSLLARLGVKPDGKLPAQDQAELNKALDQALQANPTPRDRKNGTKTAGDNKEPTDTGDPLDLSDPEQKDDPTAPTQEAGNTNASPSQSESILSKLKQGVLSLLSKSKEENPTDASGPQREQGDAKVSGDQGNAGKDKPEEGESMSTALEGQANSQSQAGQKGKLTSNEEQKGQGSGIGSQDGLKELREAEQLKAMGKIVEIIGKRAATVSGEMMVEVQSGKNQQLHTAYTNTAASHGEADGDVTRDEIPLALQPYVQQYFEQVRKAPAARPETH